jgi:hypothetical protein
VLSTCLPATDDVTNVEAMAWEKNWSHLPTMGYGSEKYTTPPAFKMAGKRLSGGQLDLLDPRPPKATVERRQSRDPKRVDSGSR